MAKAGFVAIIGRPNAGKSTLLNRVLGTTLSIVTAKAQTTRERVLGILTEPRGQLVFVDTPGIHRAREGGLNAYMVAEAREALDGVNATWYLVDPRSALQHESVVLDLLARSEAKAPVILLMNKSDLEGGLEGGGAQAKRDSSVALESTLRVEARARGIRIAGAKRISALSGEGVDELLSETWELLPEGQLFYPDEEQISDRPTRYFVAEKVREQLFRCLGDEIPYSCAVEIESFKESAKPPRIEATIHVERDSQKGMVIDKGGQKIKEIGQAARKEIELFLGQQVFLGLRVKVTKDWTRDPEALKRLGYFLPLKAQKRNKPGRGREVS